MKNKLISLSEHYKIKSKEFEKYGILNPTVNADVNLFIDPLLLKTSSHKIFRDNARNKYENFFIELKNKAKVIIKLSSDKRERAIKNTIKDICAKEMAGLCLGYSQHSNKGSGVGPEIAEKILKSAISIFEEDMDDPMIFSVLHLLEEKIGPDYISDLTAKIIKNELCEFTQEIAEKLSIPRTEMVLSNNVVYTLPKHPFLNSPIYLLPMDILSELPTESDFKYVFGTFSRTSEDIRTLVNEDISNIFSSCQYVKTSEVKQSIKNYLFRNPKAITELINHISSLNIKQYNFDEDKLGINFAIKINEYLDFTEIHINSNNNKEQIIKDLIYSFKKVFDNNNNFKRSLLWYKDKNKPEKAWQNVFNIYTMRTLEANNIDLTPEFETGSGPVDFKLVYDEGNICRTLIEMKLSSNTNYIDGFVKQTEKYKDCTENVKKAYFIFINVDKEEQKWLEKVNKLNQKKKELDIDTEIVFIDGRINPSASNL